MRHYFQLQYRLLQRQLRDFGLNPLLGQFLALLLFIGLSLYLFERTEFAQYAYVLVALYYILGLSERRRNEFLQSCFETAAYHKLRLLENALLALPFVLFLIYKTCYLATIGLIISSAVLAFLRFKSGGGKALPTPFGRMPFEFSVGFRKTFWLHGLAWFLTVMALLVDNFNLGVFALLLVFLLCLGYYGELEPPFYIWIFPDQPVVFLRRKLRAGLLGASLLSLPIAVALICGWPQNALIVLAVQCLGCAYLLTFILAKYSAFPNPIGLPQSIVLATCFVLPPLLLLALPMFFRKSSQQLSQALS